MRHTPNISKMKSFFWYQRVQFLDFIESKSEKLGRQCRIANNIGSGHTHYILKFNGKIITRSTVTDISDKDNDNATLDEKINNNEKAVVSGSNVDMNDPHRKIAGKIDASDIREDKLVQFIESDTVNGKGIPYTKDPEYNKSISTEIYDKLIGRKVLLSYERGK